VRLLLARFAPFGAMFDNPIRQRTFKADIVTSLLGLNPLVAENLFPFRLELTIK
jgi:hypothetical protein